MPNAPTETSTEKNKVEAGYDQMADAYLAWAQSHSSPRLKYTRLLLANLPSCARILELGCGAGVPITQLLLQHVSAGNGSVVGNDLSARQIELARQHCPGAELRQGDMTKLEFGAGSFDAVVSYYAIFHLPREEQEAMLRRVFEWLRPGGWFACNFATEDKAQIKDTFFEAEMFWSSFDVETNKAMVRAVGFELVEADVVMSSTDALDVDPSDVDAGVKFLWIVAKKPEKK